MEPGVSTGFTLETVPFFAVEVIAIKPLPPLERFAPRTKST